MSFFYEGWSWRYRRRYTRQYAESIRWHASGGNITYIIIQSNFFFMFKNDPFVVLILRLGYIIDISFHYTTNAITIKYFIRITLKNMLLNWKVYSVWNTLFSAIRMSSTCEVQKDLLLYLAILWLNHFVWIIKHQLYLSHFCL